MNNLYRYMPLIMFLIVNFVGLIFILNTTYYETSIKCTSKSMRLFGIFSIRDIITTVLIGGFLGYYTKVGIIKGIIIEFLIGQVLHIIYSVKTKPLYLLGLSNAPDGTGFIPNCP